MNTSQIDCLYALRAAWVHDRDSWGQGTLGFRLLHVGVLALDEAILSAERHKVTRRYILDIPPAHSSRGPTFTIIPD